MRDQSTHADIREETADSEYIPADLGAVESHIRQHGRTAVKLSFEPFGRPKVGEPDKGNYRMVYAVATEARTRLDDDKLTVRFEANGVEYALSEGKNFRDESWELMDEFPDEGHLGDLGMVLGRADPGGDGFYPVGVNVVVMLPDDEIAHEYTAVLSFSGESEQTTLATSDREAKKKVNPFYGEMKRLADEYGLEVNVELKDDNS